MFFYEVLSEKIKRLFATTHPSGKSVAKSVGSKISCKLLMNLISKMCCLICQQHSLSTADFLIKID